MYEDRMNQWLSGSTPLAMPHAGAAGPSSFFGPYNPYSQSNSPSQRMDMLAQTQRFTGTPTYKQDQNFMPTMSPEVKALWDKRTAYNAMSEADKQHARSTGNGFFNNADSGQLTNLTLGPQSMDFQTKALINRHTDRFNDQLAWNRLNEDTGNMPNFGKQVAADHLANKTWSASTINDNTNVALPEGNQVGRIFDSQINHGIDPGDRLRQFAMTHDFFSDQLNPNPQALQTQSGTRAGSGMAGQGSGNLQSFSMIDAAPPDLGWGNRGGGLASGNNWGGGISSVPQPANNPWGTPEAYNAGYHPPKPFANNSLLGKGGTGITSTGQNGTQIAYNPNSPGRGSWSGGASAPGFGPSFGDQFRMAGTGGGSSGAGGHLKFADPFKTGTESTLQGMDPRYTPEQGTGGLEGQRHRSIYGGTPEEGYKSPNLNQDYLNNIQSSNPFMESPFLISSAEGVANTGNDAFSNYGESPWMPQGNKSFASPATNSQNPNYRPANQLPWYTPINPFTAGQIMGQLGMRS